MPKGQNEPIARPKNGDLFDRVVSILEQARTNVVRAVNSNMVIAYWLIGREIVQEIQGGEQRADYGKRIIADLAESLTGRYPKGFSQTNLKYFRLFYQTYADRKPLIRQLESRGSAAPRQGATIGHKPCDQSAVAKGARRIGHKTGDVLDHLRLAIERQTEMHGFSPALSWSHYRALTRVANAHERLFYEIEAEQEKWSVPHLERQIHTLLFARLLKSRDKTGALKLARDGQALDTPIDAIKNPYVLDFLDLPDTPILHESGLEAAIMNRLQPFLLELGKGFAFVARQHRMATESQHFYIDLVFYNYLLNGAGT